MHSVEAAFCLVVVAVVVSCGPRIVQFPQFCAVGLRAVRLMNVFSPVTSFVTVQMISFGVRCAIMQTLRLRRLACHPPCT